MSEQLSIARNVLEWAAHRAPIDFEQLEKRFPRLPQWLKGSGGPTFRQLEQFSKATATPLGYLFLDEPPDDGVPIRDFRTLSDRGVGEASSNLLETIRICESRQEWYRDYIIRNDDEPIAFVGSATIEMPPEEVATRIRQELGYVSSDRSLKSFTEAFSSLVACAEAAGVLVMVSGFVGGNTRRTLSVDEFRGFTLADAHAPVVFVNGADTKAAQIFTLAHEIAHVWLGQSGISNPLPGDEAGGDVGDVEGWCNDVAAQFLVPADELPRDISVSPDDYVDALDALARRFKVSGLVILRRLYDLRRITGDVYFDVYPKERDRLIELARQQKSSGGTFYNAHPYRVSRRFARAVYADAAEGHTLYRDAFKLLGVKKLQTYEKFSQKLEVA